MLYRFHLFSSQSLPEVPSTRAGSGENSLLALRWAPAKTSPPLPAKRHARAYVSPRERRKRTDTSCTAEQSDSLPVTHKYNISTTPYIAKRGGVPYQTRPPTEPPRLEPGHG